MPFINKFHKYKTLFFGPNYLVRPKHWIDEQKFQLCSKATKRPTGKTYRKFLGRFCKKFYSGGWEAKTREQLVDRITIKSKDFDENYLQTIMKHAKTNLRKIADGGASGYFLWPLFWNIYSEGNAKWQDFKIDFLIISSG